MNDQPLTMSMFLTKKDLEEARMNAWEEMIVAAVQFAVWAAGEGLAPSKKGWQAPDGAPQGPEDFLYIFARRTGHEDYDQLPDTVRQYLRRTDGANASGEIDEFEDWRSSQAGRD